MGYHSHAVTTQQEPNPSLLIHPPFRLSNQLPCNFNLDFIFSLHVNVFKSFLSRSTAERKKGKNRKEDKIMLHVPVS